MPSLNIGGTDIHYQDIGQGSPVVVAHSSAMSSGQWRSLIEALYGEFRFLAPDLYGYGKTGDWPDGTPLTLANEAEILSRLIDLCAAPVQLVAHSYGGAVGLQALLGGEDRVTSFCAYEPVVFYLLNNGDPADEAHFETVLGIGNGVRRMVEAGDYRGGMEGFVDYWSGPGTWNKMTGEMQAELAPRTPKVVLDFSASTGEPTTSAKYASIDIPFLILSGTQSPPASKRIAEVVAGLIPNAAHEIIDGAGHMGPVTNAAQVNAHITAHLRHHRP